MQHTKKPKIWRRIALVLLLFLGYQILFSSKFSYQEIITIKEGDTFQSFLGDLSWKHRLQIKWYIKSNAVDFSKLQKGSYIFSGNYSPKTFVATIHQWPQVAYHTIKILEWWSIFDIDTSLTSKWLIKEWDYIALVTNPDVIGRYQAKYPFLPQNIQTLEWFLYPDTYKVDREKNSIDQLVYLQLENFKKKVWDKVSELPQPLGLDWYKTITLASIVEKEERSSKNRPIVAGILLKRLQLGTLVGADISLCYFFRMPYAECTPNFIAKNVKQPGNPYDTRAVKGLPPTPVSNPTTESILAVLQPTQTEYFYYLHNDLGQIYYAKTLDEHNANKKNYLK
jgi:UPF0755 protein